MIHTTHKHIFLVLAETVENAEIFLLPVPYLDEDLIRY